MNNIDVLYRFDQYNNPDSLSLALRMDTELARTFLTVIDTGSFSAAAIRLHVTQSTISARIHTLECFLGCALFVRNKAGTALTLAGQQFRRHASMLVRTVEQARYDVGVSRGYSSSVALGGRFGLWEDFLTHWLGTMRDTQAQVSVRAEIGFEQDLMQGLIEGRLDIGVMYTPQARPGLVVEKLFEETLTLVQASTGVDTGSGGDYVHVDWGPEFFARYSAQFPDNAAPAVSVNIGWLGLRHILAAGGSGYFPRRLTAPYLKDGTLTRVADAPIFALPAYAVYPQDDRKASIDAALDVLRRICSELSTPELTTHEQFSAEP